jgi:hypothetical protein
LVFVVTPTAAMTESSGAPKQEWPKPYVPYLNRKEKTMVGKARRGTTTLGQKAGKASEANGSSSETERPSSTATAACVPIPEPAAKSELSPAGAAGEAASAARTDWPDYHCEDVEISEIILEEHGELDDRQVDSLVESIGQMGLLQPVGLAPDRRLIYGRHRVAACRKLGRTSIPAVIFDLDNPLLVELARIDENLQRKVLTKLEQSQALARRKEIYEELHPETRLGNSQATGCNRVQGHHVTAKLAPTFAEDTAAKSGKGLRSVQREAKIGQNLDPQAAEMLKGTAVEDNQAELEAVSRLPAQQQREVAVKIKAGKMKSVRNAESPEVPENEGEAEEGLRLLEMLVAALKDCGVYEDVEHSVQQISEALENCGNDEETGE